MTMKQLSSFAVLSVNGGDRMSITYETIDDETGEVVATNTKESFYVLDAGVSEHIDAIRAYLRAHKLN